MYSRRSQLKMPQLSDLIHLCTNLFCPPPAPRTTERKTLQIPVHEAVDKPEMSPVLAAAAAQLATSGKLWKWITTDGTAKLTAWDSQQQLFIRGTTVDWAVFIGQHWKVKDTKNIEYAGPSVLVTDRLIAAVLAHPQTPVASFALQLRMKREGTK
jgi:hypothetical protein